MIRIYTVGSSNDYYKNIFEKEIIEGLENKYIFNFIPINPFYLIYDVFICEYLKKNMIMLLK